MSTRQPSLWRTRLILATCLVGAGGGGGCSCKQETLPPVVFEEGDRQSVDPTRVLAPPWQAPAISQLDNGALLYWLHEPDNPAFHLRLLLPTTIHGDKLDAAGTAVALTALEQRLQARLRRISDSSLDLRSRPGRVEVAVHGRDRDAEALIAAVADSLADAGSPKLLAMAQGKVVAGQGRTQPEVLATAGLVSRLLDQPLEQEFTDEQQVAALSKGRLEKAWSLLTDPRDAVVLIHSGREPGQESAALAAARMGVRWKAPIGIGSGQPTITERLRHNIHERRKPLTTRLLTEQEPAAMLLLPNPNPGHGGERGEVVLGRLIATPTAEDRTMARLCQRILQEELDARLIHAGPVSLFAVRVRISGDDPVASLAYAIDRMRAYAGETQPRNRIEQAATLWLGARMVEASLNGEDWTSLWSDSIDLAGEDREIFSALAREAQSMLEVDPEALQAYFGRWFDPKAGEPGWTWVAAGVDDALAASLGQRIELVRP
ncbi:MAG: hypothetical protein KC457_12185 [Myxococcales bacterium]|nr:hypothetical protein [Myxococcales bacterium]